MKFTIAAVHCIIDKDGNLVLDPDQYQSHECRAHFTFVFDSIERDLITVHSMGCFKIAQFNDAYAMSRAASGLIFEFYRKIMTKFHTKTISTKPVDDEPMEN